MNTERKNIIGEMTERESLDAFIEGSRKCASCAREMAKECEDKGWEDIAAMLEAMGENGVKLSRMKSMTRLETLMAANMKSKSFIVN